METFHDNVGGQLVEQVFEIIKAKSAAKLR